jgi:ABC-2 type transport system ATP-binding protein
MSAATKTNTRKAQEAEIDEKKEKVVARVGGDPVVISARRISMWYGQVIGINDVSLDIGPGVTGLLGPNGAGKSTLLKVMSGQLRPSTGSVAVFGEPLWGNPSIFSRIGLVPEQDSFYEKMSGEEFIVYLTRLQGFSKSQAEKIADETIETVGLTNDKHRAIEEYSKGMRQRIKIAQALAHDPDVLFLDEPLTGTDPVGRRQVIDLIKELGDAGKTIIVSSHVLHEVEQMTKEILLINKGRVLAEGNLHRIRELIDEHPHSIFIDSDQPRKFAALLAEYDDVVSIQFEKKGIRISTREPDEAYSRIPKIALENDIKLHGMMSPDNNLMSVFNYLVQ